MRCEYVDWEYGQLHVRRWGLDHAGKPPLICLPPAPFSSLAYNTLGPLLAADHHVIALDYPGFGGSSAVPRDLVMADLSNAAAAIADAFAPGLGVSLLGFHTGTIVAADMAISHADRVDHLMLIDVPFFDEQQRRAEFEEKPRIFPLSSDADMLEPAWHFNVARRVGLIELPRAFENFVDMISSGEGRNAAFRASFEYDCMAAFAKLRRPATCIATAAMLTQQTRDAAAAIPNAKLIELPEIPTAVLDAGAKRLAQVVLQELAS